MKKLILAAFGAALIGGLTTFGGLKMSGNLDGQRTGWAAPAFNGQVKFANFANGQSGTAAVADFTISAAKTLPVVVNIQSSQRVREQVGMNPFGGGGFGMQDMPAPFRQFFEQSPRRNQRGGREKSNENVQLGTGSGVVISPDGYIVTNNHVVVGADELTVTLNDKRSFKAKVIGTDPSTDLGLIKVEADGLPFANFSNSDAVQVGEWVLAVGNPFNLTSTVTAGIVSAKGRDIHINQDQAPIESFIQTDAAINPGNSGGALVNLNGDLIGINSAIASPTGAYAGYGFAIPANIVAKVVDDLKKYGVTQRGYLGVIIHEVNSDLAKEKGLTISQGVYVDSLADNSSAGAAGVKKGDVITKIDGQEVDAASDVLEAVGSHRPGDKINLTVWRKGESRDFSVELKNKQGNTDIVKKSGLPASLAGLGAEFRALPANEAKKLDIPGGVEVTSLGEGKIANQTDMSEGFIVTKVDGKRVQTVEELAAALSGKEGGVMVEGVYPDRPGAYYYAFGM